MSRVRIFQPGCPFCDSLRIADDEIVRKIQTVLRVKPGADVFVFDGKGKESSYTVEAITKREVVLKKGTIQRHEVSPVLRVTLAVPLLKEAKIEFLLQKVSELGIIRIIPYIPARGSIRKKPSCAKLHRWQKIVSEAIRQSQRLWSPEIERVRGFREVLDEAADVKIAAHPSGGMLEDILPKNKTKTVLLIVGPEGDFSDEELQNLTERGFCRVSLSAGVLRAETAAVCVAGLISYFYQV